MKRKKKGGGRGRKRQKERREEDRRSASMIAMLSHLKINIKVSDIDIKTTVGSDDYRET